MVIEYVDSLECYLLTYNDVVIAFTTVVDDYGIVTLRRENKFVCHLHGDARKEFLEEWRIKFEQTN